MIRITTYKEFLTDFLIKERLLSYDIDGFITIEREFITNTGVVKFKKTYEMPYVNISSKEEMELFLPELKYSVEENFYRKTGRYVIWDANVWLYDRNFWSSDLNVYFGIYQNKLVYFLDISTRYFDSYSHSKNDLCLSLERLKNVNKKMKIST